MFFRNIDNMNGKFLLNTKFITGIVTVIAFVALGFFAMEAKKEIYFLCGNFEKGMSFSSVIAQLDTATMSSYKITDAQTGKAIKQSSWLVLQLASCNVNFNQEGVVVSASFG